MISGRGVYSRKEQLIIRRAITNISSGMRAENRVNFPVVVSGPIRAYGVSVGSPDSGNGCGLGRGRVGLTDQGCKSRLGAAGQVEEVAVRPSLHQGARKSRSAACEGLPIYGRDRLPEIVKYICAISGNQVTALQLKLIEMRRQEGPCPRGSRSMESSQARSPPGRSLLPGGGRRSRAGAARGGAGRWAAPHQEAALPASPPLRAALRTSAAEPDYSACAKYPQLL